MSTNFSNDDEQLENISQWWSSYKYIVTGSLIAIVLTILSWDYYKKQTLENALSAAKDYQYFIENFSLDDDVSQENFEIEALRIITIYSNQGYADLAALQLSKYYVIQNRLQEAEVQLRWILDRNRSNFSNNQEPLSTLASTRLARLLLSQNKSQEVIDFLSESKALNASLLELKGDALVLLGRLNEAKVSYLESLNLNRSPLLKNIILMKIADLEILDE